MLARRMSNIPEEPRAKVFPRKIWFYPYDDMPWLISIYELNEKNKLSSDENKIYWHVDSLLCEEKFSECDRLLKAIQLDKLAPELWTAFLIITAAAKDKLQARAAFFSAIQARLIALGEKPEEILHGLE